MNYEFEYCTLDEKQVKAFAYNLKNEVIRDYVETHQEEFRVWQDNEKIKEIVKKAVFLTGYKQMSLKERLQLIETLKLKQTERSKLNDYEK